MLREILLIMALDGAGFGLISYLVVHRNPPPPSGYFKNSFTDLWEFAVVAFWAGIGMLCGAVSYAVYSDHFGEQ